MLEMETNLNQKVSCVVNYAYDASESDELTIRPGDVLRDVERLPGGWWRGELHGRRGMFPDNFVSMLTEHANTSRSAGVQGRCRAVFSYQPANPDELPLSVGDVLEVLEEVEEGWWQGRRQGRVGVFPSNFVVMLDPPQSAPPPYEPAPALPPKPVKECCRVLFPYTAVNDDELTLAEGDIVTVISKDAPDRGWWRGELQGRVGLFPDNFVQLLPAVSTELVEEKKPERPPSKTTNPIYPVLNKYSEKTASVKELTTSKTSMHKESTLSKEISTQSTVTHTNKNESDKLIHNETITDGVLDGQVKKPPVPLKKSPTPSSGVSGLLSGLKNKMLSSTDKEKASSATVSNGTSGGVEWDRLDGISASKSGPPPVPTSAVPGSTTAPSPTPTPTNTNTFDHVERNSILSDPRVGRAKAPRRRPPSQVLRDDTPQQIGLSNGHEVPTVEKPSTEKTEEIKPRTREWEKHKAPWMEELKLNQAKKTSFGADGKSRSVSSSSEASGVASKAGGGSTDRILECGVEEKRSSSHSMEMSKSTSSISSRMSVMESFEETKVRYSLDSKKDTTPAPREVDTSTTKPVVVHSPTAAGRTLIVMFDEVKKPLAPSPPSASTRTNTESVTVIADRSPNSKSERIIEKQSEITTISKSASVFEKSTTSSSNSSSSNSSGGGTLERVEKVEERLPEKLSSGSSVEKTGSSVEKMGSSVEKTGSSTLERRLTSHKLERNTTNETDALIAQLNNRISNLEKLLEVQNTMFKSAIDELNHKLKLESEKRQTLQTELEKLAHCVTQV